MQSLPLHCHHWHYQAARNRILPLSSAPPYAKSMVSLLGFDAEKPPLAVIKRLIAALNDEEGPEQKKAVLFAIGRL
jgi:hypothetical protein